MELNKVNMNKTYSRKTKNHLKVISKNLPLIIASVISSYSFAQDSSPIPNQQSEATTAESTVIKLQPAINADNLDEVYREHATNSRWENLSPPADFYNSPYQVSLFSPQNGENGDRVWSQTKAIFGYGFGVIGLIALLPEDISNWDSEESIFSKWSDNVKDGPVWDRDTGPLNLIGHPYFGGSYYQVARKSGYRQWDSFMYSALMSTFYWEYGIEAFAEVPSIQDLVITPVLGWAYGEWAFNTDMELRKSGGEIWGSSTLGNIAFFFLDPSDYMSAGINNIFGKEIIIAGSGYVGVKDIPYGNDGKTDNQISLNVSFQLGDGGSYTKSRTKAPSRSSDPVDRGIIGLSYGYGSTQLDDSWEIEGDTTQEYSLGLYFSPKFSTRLSYSKGKFYNEAINTEQAYENYSLDSQYYFNAKSAFRPYVTAGFGENMWLKEQETTQFQWNAGVGVHYKLNNNFSIQADWRTYYGTKTDSLDNSATMRLVYFIGKGQR